MIKRKNKRRAKKIYKFQWDTNPHDGDPIYKYCTSTQISQSRVTSFQEMGRYDFRELSEQEITDLDKMDKFLLQLSWAQNHEIPRF